MGKRTFGILMVVAGLLLNLFGDYSVSAADLPKFLTMGTMPAGMTVNAQGVGIADICNQYTPMQIRVRATTDQLIWVPMTVTGEVQLGVANALGMREAYLGIGGYAGVAKKMGVKGFPLRAILGGSAMHINFIVSGNFEGDQIGQLRGKRVASYAKGIVHDLYTRALLANGGLTLEDVKEIPMSQPVAGTQAVMDGRADATEVAIGAPITSEAIAKVNARFLPVDPSPEAVKRMKGVIDTAYVSKVPGGKYLGVPKDAELMSIDTILVASKDLSEAAVYEITKALWEHNPELVKNPTLNEWKKDNFATTRVGVPYHEGAVRFFKEKGCWTDELDQFQKGVLAEQP